MNVTAEALVASAQRRAFMPASGKGISDAEWLNILNETLFDYCVPFVTKHRKYYWLSSKDISLVSGTATYPIPSRAAGARFYAIQLLDASGQPATPMLTPLEPEEALGWPQSTLRAGRPIQYTVMGNSIVLSPPPQAPLAAPTMRVYFYRRPSTLVLSSAVQNIYGYEQHGASTIRITLGAAAIFSIGQSVELVRGVSGFETDGPYTVTSTSTLPDTVDMAGTVPAAAQAGNATTGQVGDTVCLAEQANVITNMPEDWGWWVAQAAAVEALGDRGDDAKFNRAAGRLKMLEDSVASQLSQRDVSAAHKMRNQQRSWSVRRPPFYVP